MRSRIGWLLALLVVALGVALLARRVPAVFTSAGVLFIDPDDWLRAYRARTILDGGPWCIQRIADINWPLGVVHHWTAPMDWLLVVAATLLGPLAGGSEAHRLETVAACVPVALGAIYLALMMGMIRRAYSWTPAILAGLFVAIMPPFARAFALGHPDHQGLLELLFLISVAAWVTRSSPPKDLFSAPRENQSPDHEGGVTLPDCGPDETSAIGSLAIATPQVRRTLNTYPPGVSQCPRPGAVLISGAAIGLAIWVAAQAIFVWAAVLAGVCWATFRAPPDARSAWLNRRQLWTWSALGVATIGHIIENAAHPLAVQADRIGLVQLALIAWGIFLPAPRPPAPDTPSGRTQLRGLRLVPSAIATAILISWFVADRTRIFAPVASAEFVRWSARIAELQPLYVHVDGQWSFAEMRRQLGNAPFFLAVLYPFWRSRNLSPATKLTFTFLAVGFSGAAIFQRRWIEHVNLGLAPVLTIGAWEISKLWNRRHPGKLTWGSIAIAFVLLFPIVQPAAEYRFAHDSPAEIGPLTLRAACVAEQISAYEKNHPASPDRPRAICAEEGDGPMLLYRTGRPVVAAPYHRGIAGIVAMARYFSQRDENAALDQLHDLGVGYVVVPYRPHEQLRNFEYIADGALSSFERIDEKIDADGRLKETFHYLPQVAQTMAYRLAIEPDCPPAGLQCITRTKEGAQTPDGLSGLLYVVR